MGEAFSEMWQAISGRLNVGDSIPNWTVLKGNLGDFMNVVQVDARKIIIQAPKSEHQIRIYRKEFEKIGELWPAYKAEQIQRQEIRDITFHSKYIISIFHWVEENK